MYVQICRDVSRLAHSRYIPRFIAAVMFGTYIRRVAYPGILFGGGVQQIQLMIEDRENGDLGAVAP